MTVLYNIKPLDCDKCLVVSNINTYAHLWIKSTAEFQESFQKLYKRGCLKSFHFKKSKLPKHFKLNIVLKFHLERTFVHIMTGLTEEHALQFTFVLLPTDR